jgi:hypothetical protein
MYDGDGVMEVQTALILVRDVLGGGLFAALAEGAGFSPVFPFAGEKPETAVERLRPSHVLLECYHPAARSDAFYEGATHVGSRIILFAPTAPWQDFEEMGRRRNVEAFIHPANGDSLAGLIAEALSAERARRL